MSKVKNICLSCSKYRPLDLEKGLCRLEKKEKVEDYPEKKHEDGCDSWIDCGQQYYIRTGWLKKTAAKESDE